MTQIDVVCLANSRKHGGRCVAGWPLMAAGSCGSFLPWRTAL